MRPASRISFMSMEEVRQRVAAADRILVIFMYASATPTTRVMCPRPPPARGQIELRVDQELPDPTARILATASSASSRPSVVLPRDRRRRPDTPAPLVVTSVCFMSFTACLSGSLLLRVEGGFDTSREFFGRALCPEV